MFNATKIVYLSESTKCFLLKPCDVLEILLPLHLYKYTSYAMNSKRFGVLLQISRRGRTLDYQFPYR